MNATFERPVRIRFSHCDPAGIVFFPQYLVMTNALVEDWFNEGARHRLRADDRARGASACRSSNSIASSRGRARWAKRSC